MTSFSLGASAPEPRRTDGPTQEGVTPTAGEASAQGIQAQPAGGLIPSISFLELPFPFDGGNEHFGGTDEQFRKANQRTWNGGRINSFFDHQYPLYPAEHEGREPADQPISDHMLLFDGSYSEKDYYSGHPGYDYSTYEYRQPTTPVFAAADGEVYWAGECCGGALVVKIKHQVAGVGDFLTIYMHLHPDKWFERMKGTEGKLIPAGTRIGTMGNTGWSTGHHLHFEVRFDADEDGQFRLDEALDPYGYVPSAAFPQDPWGRGFTIETEGGVPRQHSPSVSPYLWVHPLGVGGQMPAEGGGQMGLGDGVGGEARSATLCAEPDSVPPGGTTYWTWVPDPPVSEDLVGTGNSSVVTGTDEEGGLVDTFDPPLVVEIPLDQAELEVVDPATLGVFWRTPEGLWSPLPGHVDLVHGVAVAQVSQPGHIALLGRPTRDLVPPRTQIQVSGPASEEGEWYEQVTVTLNASDPSGVERIEYSLDNGSTWQPYTGPFTLDRQGIPADLQGDGDPEEVLGGGRGNHLLLASATDGAGNVEVLPAYRLVVIDPSKNPDPTATALVDVNCRFGPGLVYDVIGSLLEAETAPLAGRNVDDTWWWIERLRGVGHCWVSGAVVVVGGDLSEVPVIAAPPTPTPETTPPEAPTRFRIAARVCSGQQYSVSLEWIDNAENETGYRIYREGQVLTELAPDSIGYTDQPPYGGPYTYLLEAFNEAGASDPASLTEKGCNPLY